MSYLKKYAALCFIIFLSSCSTTNVSNLPEPICSGRSALKKHIWTISFSQKMPPGLELAKTANFVKTRADLQENISNGFVHSLIYLSANNGHYTTQSSYQKNLALNKFAYYLADERSASLIETGPANFISCTGVDCENLKDPINNKMVKKYYDTEFAKRAGSSTRPIYYVEGIIDPTDSQFQTHMTSTFSNPSPAYIEWSEYFRRNPFNGGGLLSNNYFKLPESKKSELCQKASFNKDCFNFPKYDSQLKLVTSNDCSNDSDCLAQSWSSSPFKMQFIQDNNGLCGLSCKDDINIFLKKLSSDPYFKLDWENTITKDILLKLSISTTRKVEKDWITSRIEWNPTLFCQYAKPGSELISQ